MSAGKLASANPHVLECGRGPALPLGSSRPVHQCTGPYSGFSCSRNAPTFPSSTPQNDKEVGRDRERPRVEPRSCGPVRQRASLTCHLSLDELGLSLCNCATSEQCSYRLSVYPKLARIIAGASLQVFYFPLPVCSAHTA